LLLRWRRRRGLWKKVRAARMRQERGLRKMDAVVRRFREQHPSVDMVAILSLPLPELSKKIQDGSLPPEHVFYAYVGKVRSKGSGAACHMWWGWLLGEAQHKVQMLLCCNCLLVSAGPFCAFLSISADIYIPLICSFCFCLSSYDCKNMIFGQTLNPLLYTRTPGGSSGGEGALVGGGGSILGFGTDVGGSLRFPAAFCGICALKPTGNRLSKKGVISGVVGQKAVAAALGPIAKDVDSLALCMRALLCEDMFNLDSTVPPLPFNEEVYSSTQPLRIGYYETDFFTMPSPAMRRAVREAKQLLEDAGHTLVPFEITNVDHVIFNFCVRGLFADGGVSFVKKFNGELEKSSVGVFFWLAKSPEWLKRVLSWIFKPFVRSFFFSSIDGVKHTVDEVWSLHQEIEEFCHQFIAQWKKLNLDVMLCPMLGPALSIGYPQKLSVAVSYTMLYNALDFPAGVVPVTLVTDEDEEELKSYQGYYRDWWDRTLAKAFSDSQGMPVAVQCVALPWQDELCLRFMKEVETL
ncbi:FAAH1 hydrolase, partial [Todus mexicanus]|nr:FAAH1 hydrolase [Todus mexicanus]